MTYSSSFHNLPELLRQPTSIATIASLAFHGLLGVALPVTPSSGPEAIPEAVDLVELSSAEQSRLPSIANSPLLLPPNEAANLFSSLPSDLNDPLAKAPSVTSTLDLPPVPAAPRFEIVPPPDLKNWPYLQKPANNQAVFNLPLADIPTPVLTPPSKQDLAALPPEIFLPPPVKSPTFDQLPQLQAATPLQPVPLEPPVQASPSPQPQESPAQQPERSPEELAQEQRLREEQQQRQAEDLGGEIALGTPLPQTSPEASPEAAPPVDERVAQAYARQQEIREQIAYNAAGTTPEDATANLQTWLEQIQKSSGQDDLTWEMQAPEVAATYPKLACLNRLEGTATIGVLVDPEGQVVGEPQLIQSAGYPVLNQAAVAAVAGQTFEAKGEFKAYPVKVKFQPSEERCAGTPSIQETVEQAVS